MAAHDGISHYEAILARILDGEYHYDLACNADFNAIVEADVKEQREILRFAIQNDLPRSRKFIHQLLAVRQEIMTDLLSRKLPLTDADLCLILDSDAGRSYYHSIVTQLLSAVEEFAETNDALPDRLRTSLQHAKAYLLRSEWPQKEAAKHSKRISKILGDATDQEFAINPREPWANRLLEDIEQLADEQQSSVRRLASHASAANSSKPSAKWLKEAELVMAEIDESLLIAALTVWVSDFDTPAADRGEVWPHSEWSVSEVNADLLKGLIWIASRFRDEKLIRAIAQAGISAQRKIPGFGPRSGKVTNASVWALGEIDHSLAIAQLAILKSRIKNKGTQKQIDKAMNAVAERLGVPPDEVEEMVVPTFGLNDVGVRTQVLGDFTAELVVTGTSSAEIRWLKADGKRQKTTPKSVKEDFADELKELQAAKKDVQKLLPSQRDRIDSLFLQQKVWSFQEWSERYFDHPLVGVIARRVIWEFETNGDTASGIWLDGIVDRQGKSLSLDPEGTRVRLWHPIERDTDEVLAWREFLETNQVTQPFKQAHREVYLLTDAERNTDIYSNRYAAHILKQHQFNALCGARRWSNKLRLMVDDEHPPASRDLVAWDLRAEFWVEGAGGEYGVDTNETGTFLYLATDQVRFYPLGATMHYAHASGGGYEWSRYRGEHEPTPLSLDQIPPIVFSEVMRDVDLFVGVASVGNDPNWHDGGPRGQYHEYWHGYSFGELTASAKTRKEILERLIPRLKIAKQCSFEDKFLVVEGSKRTYKIHLGSGNILMKPNDQYLCIVPKPQTAKSATSKMFLPFEVDRVMSIILSKALMLAEDQKITDQTILSQIG